MTLEMKVLEMIANGLLESKELVGSHFLDLVKYLEYEQDDIFDFKKEEDGYSLTYLRRIDLQMMFEYHLVVYISNGMWTIRNKRFLIEYDNDHSIKRNNMFAAILDYIKFERILCEQNIALSSDTVYISEIKMVEAPWVTDNQIVGYFNAYFRGREYCFGFDKTDGEKMKIRDYRISDPYGENVEEFWTIGEMIYYKLSARKIKILCDIPEKAWIFEEKYFYTKRLEMAFKRQNGELRLYTSRLDDPRIRGAQFSDVDFIKEIDKAVNAINKYDNGREFVLFINFEDPYLFLEKQQLMNHIREMGCEAGIVFNNKSKSAIKKEV